MSKYFINLQIRCRIWYSNETLLLYPYLYRTMINKNANTVFHNSVSCRKSFPENMWIETNEVSFVFYCCWDRDVLLFESFSKSLYSYTDRFQMFFMVKLLVLIMSSWKILNYLWKYVIRLEISVFYFYSYDLLHSSWYLYILH